MTARIRGRGVSREYRVSGVKTFIVNQNGIVYERDLGAMTIEIASAMKDYNPTPAWRKVQ